MVRGVARASLSSPSQPYLALGTGTVIGELLEFHLRELFGAGVLERAGALEHQGRDQDHRQKRKPLAYAEKPLEFRFVAVESETSEVRLPARRLRRMVEIAFRNHVKLDLPPQTADPLPI
jgi:hypothetical protein